MRQTSNGPRVWMESLERRLMKDGSDAALAGPSADLASHPEMQTDVVDIWDPGAGTATRLSISLPPTAYKPSFQLAPDGDILAYKVSRDSGDMIDIWRFNADGTPDYSFGIDGRASGPGLALPDGYRVQLLQQIDGKLLAIAGPIQDYVPDRPYEMVRFNGDGSLDATFGTGGVVNGLVPGACNYCGFIQDDGRIVIEAFAGEDLVLRAYKPDGSLDTSFANGGDFAPKFGPDERFFGWGLTQAVQITSDGQVELFSWQAESFAKYAFYWNVFDSEGMRTTHVLIPAPDYGWGVPDLAIQPDGKPVMLTDGGDLLRFDINWLPDPQFGQGGRIEARGIGEPWLDQIRFLSGGRIGLFNIHGNFFGPTASLQLDSSGEVLSPGLQIIPEAEWNYSPLESSPTVMQADGKLLTWYVPLPPEPPDDDSDSATQSASSDDSADDSSGDDTSADDNVRMEQSAATEDGEDDDWSDDDELDWLGSDGGDVFG